MHKTLVYNILMNTTKSTDLMSFSHIERVPQLI